MPQDPRATFEQSILEMIEQSPTGAVPATPAHQDALRHLLALHQVYPSADHKDGYVTVRSLAARPSFHAGNLDALGAGTIGWEALEPDGSIFDRYVASLPADLRPKAAAYRTVVVGRLVLHRKHEGVVVRDPVHTLFLVPGAGLNPGLPGNYLHGSLRQERAEADGGGWTLQLHDRDDGLASCQPPSLADALALVKDVLASAPFHLSELDGLGFEML